MGHGCGDWPWLCTLVDCADDFLLSDPGEGTGIIRVFIDGRNRLEHACRERASFTIMARRIMLLHERYRKLLSPCSSLFFLWRHTRTCCKLANI